MIDESPLSDIKIGEITAGWAKSHRLKTNYYKVTDSTNLQAKNCAFTPDEFENEFVLYLAEAQNQGRGRFDRTWTTPAAGSSLLSTWSFLINETPSLHITSKVGLALYSALKNTWQTLPLSLKAPNDIYIKNRKVAGILVETVSQGDDYRLLIGVGLNVFSHPKDIETSTDIISNLSKSTPLLGEDWILFLDRFLFELSAIVGTASEDLTSTQQANLIEVLNQNPLLENKYTDFKDVVKNL